ncbi:MAG: biotin--[acetyl-CoA-carboxylase] ligase [Acidimicrobiia bacterium]
MPGDSARSRLAGTRFADVRWVAETGSTNADALALARDGEREGVVVVADHQTAGRGRFGRSWQDEPGSALLASVLLRPAAEVAPLATTALGVAAVEAVAEVAGVEVRLKWPNDLVVGPDHPAADRKLAGILAEADWPTGSSASSGYRPPARGERVVVVVGIGLNLRWPVGVPEELADRAVALDELAPAPVEREDLLVALLGRLAVRYAELGSPGGAAVLHRRAVELSATLGRRVRVDVGREDVFGTAVDLTVEGRLVVETADGRRTLDAGDVVHLRPGAPGS